MGIKSMKTYRDSNGKINVGIVENGYSGNSFAEREFSHSPKILETGGLKERLSDLGCNLRDISEVRLSPQEEQERGSWRRLGYALGHLGRFAAEQMEKGYFPIGLLSNCPSLTGMLAGVQHSAGLKPLRVGLVWFDAHGDFNTPESSVSGTLGGMPVAVSAGLCLDRIRFQAGLDPPLPTRYIIMGGVRNIQPYEQELIDRSEIEFLSVDDIKTLSGKIDDQMKRLSRLTDIIYIHVDMDVLDPAEVPGFNHPVHGGPTSRELSAAITAMFRYEKAAAFGVASTPYRDDKDGLALNAAYRLIEGAIKGLRER
jgi:arginase